MSPAKDAISEIPRPESPPDRQIHQLGSCFTDRTETPMPTKKRVTAEGSRARGIKRFPEISVFAVFRELRRLVRSQVSNSVREVCVYVLYNRLIVFDL